MTEAREQEALAWLYSLADQERGIGWNPAASVAEQWKLGRTRALLDLAGAPDRRLLVVLVAGTKGKGSTAVLLASILHAAGVRTGLFTKPHLQSYRERIRLGGAALTPEAFARGVDTVRGIVAQLRRVHPEAGEPTTFESTVVLAIQAFAEGRCRVAVVEVGLGGRLDATNVLEPVLSLITSISRDHTAVLGRTLGSITQEKAGILRPGRPALLALQRPTAERTLARACRLVGARCRWVPPLARVTGGGGEDLVVLDAAAPVPLALVGDHQRHNAGLAVAAARELAALGEDVSEAAITEGLRHLTWPGRFEVIPGAPQMVLDGAHNDGSARALAAALRRHAAGRRVHLVLGINRDKDARAVLSPLLDGAASVWTASAGHARALPSGELAERCRRLARIPVYQTEDVSSALEGARRASRPGDVVCVSGSLAVVGQARDLLGLPVAEQLFPLVPSVARPGS